MFLRTYEHSSKTNPLVDEVEILQANQHYAWICYSDGKETSILVKCLASTEKQVNVDSEIPPNSHFSNYC